MSDQEKNQKVEDGMVVSLDYTLRVDGEVVDSSDDSEPIYFIQGQQSIISGLEKELYGMSVGQEKSVHVLAAEGYGELDPDAMMEVPKDEFPDEIPLEPGVELEMEDDDGEMVSARIVSIKGKMVQLDFNHPLAGKNLDFEVKVTGLRKATAEEMDHGHVHEEGHEH